MKNLCLIFIGDVIIRNIRPLNINNTYRSANINVKVRKRPNQLLNYHDLTLSSLHKLYITLQKLKKEKKPFNKVFIGRHDKNEYRAEEQQIARDGFPFNYYSNTVFPLPVLLACNSNKNAIVFYNYQGRPLTDKELSSVSFASKVCRVGIRLPIILGKFNPILTLIDLFDVRFFVERVELDFIGLTPTQLNTKIPKDYRNMYYKYGSKWYPSTKVRLMYYDQMHEILARYKMQLFLFAENKQQAKVLKSKGLKIANK